MADKKYYWLKMEGNFFDQKEIRKLRRIAGGDTYVIIYLKMSLLSLKDDGRLYYEGVEDTFAEELAEELRESTENVQMTISYLQSHNMLESHNSDELYMNRIPEMTGKETDSARRKRQQRLRDKNNLSLAKSDNVLIDCDNVQKCHTEIEKETREDLETEKELDIDIELKEHFENVWALYPVKKGKGQYTGKKAKLKHIHRKSVEEWEKLINRYVSSVEDKKYLVHGSTFFNTEYVDYLDENYQEDKPLTFRTQEEKRYYMLLDMKKETPEYVTDAEIEEKRKAMEESLK